MKEVYDWGNTFSQCKTCHWQDVCIWAEKLRYSVSTGKNCKYIEVIENNEKR
jgi:hypothetical protein